MEAFDETALEHVTQLGLEVKGRQFSWKSRDGSSCLGVGLLVLGFPFLKLGLQGHDQTGWGLPLAALITLAGLACFFSKSVVIDCDRKLITRTRYWSFFPIKKVSHPFADCLGILLWDHRKNQVQLATTYMSFLIVDEGLQFGNPVASSETGKQVLEYLHQETGLPILPSRDANGKEKP